MRTLDYPYLATNPEGDTRADFSLSLEVPKSIDIPLNPDGTRPSVTLAVESDTYAIGLAALELLNEDPDDFMLEWLSELLTEKQKAELTEATEQPAFLKETVSKIHEQFLVFSTQMTMTVTATASSSDPDVDAAVTESESIVDLTLTAPSISIGMKALIGGLTSPQRRTSVAVSLSPERVDDDGFDSNEVLVIR